MTWDKQVANKLKQLKSEYDLDELAANDLLQLNNLAEAMASLDTYTEMLEWELSCDERNIKNISDIQRLIIEVGKNISSISNDLKIDRKSRERKTESVPDYIKDLKERGRKFLEQRMYYIYCPICKELLISMWILNKNFGHKFKCVCPQCKHEFVVNASDLELHKNIPDVIVPISTK